ncbi:MAG: TetR/AcrR family transcriptional regulator [Firmicutes bacterium]|jgi:TetR/AcrR family fatty acid metabolism transcriptional regulator|nr:TetR/AcrR family transcriptional regulator [Bacillota bacterium]
MPRSVGEAPAPEEAECGAMPEKQAQILDAALHVFRDWGFHEAKIEEIALAAGVGKGTIYEYFENKADLFQQTVVYHINRFWRIAEEYVSRAATAREKIERIVESEARLLRDEDAVAYLLLQDTEPVSNDLRNWLWKQRAQVILESIRGVVQRGIEDGEIRPVDSAAAACFVFMAFHAFIGMRLIARGRDQDRCASSPNSEQVRTILDLIFNGLAV